MFTRILMLAMLCPTVVAATNERPCYLELRQTLVSILDHAPNDSWAQEQLKSLSAQVKIDLASPSLSTLDRLYLQGYLAFDEGRLTEARNYLLQYSRRRPQIEGFAEDRQWKEVQIFFTPLNMKRVEEKKLMESKADDEPVTKRRSTKKSEDPLFQPATQLPPPMRDKPPAKKRKASVTSHDILKKARQAQSNGQLDSALQFYKLAATIDPDSPDVKNELSALEKEMQ